MAPLEAQGEAGSADASPEARCQATTRDGHQCRNRPLDGSRYCRLHAGAAVADAEEIPVAAARAPASAQVAGAAMAVEELEVSIRNQEAGEAAAREFAAGALRLIRENLPRLPADAVQRAAALIRENVSSDYLDPDFWRGVGMVLQYQLDELSGLAQRRMRGEYTLDEYGMDAELVDLVRPLSSFLYRTYWRVGVEGLAYVPDEGRALLVANHGGVLPWDAVMIASAVLEDHSSPRVVRTLYPSIFRFLPGVGRILTTFGQVADTAENAARLLEQDQLVLVFPEGAEGLGKLFWNRYKIQRFRRGGSAGLAIRAGAPIVPVAVVGAEETYPMLADIRPLAEALRLPFFPVTPLFPWLGPLGLIPLPSKWSIAFGEPIATAEYGPDAADDPALVARLGEEVRARVQELLDERLAARPSAFS
jgi:1-acyl-sn-glycerol-3-phosphate acyltransferase